MRELSQATRVQFEGSYERKVANRYSGRCREFPSVLITDSFSHPQPLIGLIPLFSCRSQYINRSHEY